MYADDLVLWSTEEYTKTPKIRLQEATNILSNWAQYWCVKINKTKSFTTLFTLSTKSKPMKIMLDDTELQHTDSATYLGIAFDQRHTWKTHISRAEANARRKLALLRKLTGTQWVLQKKVLRNRYIRTIRPHLEYGSTTLSSASKSAIYTLDKVQNQALQLITTFMKYTPIRVMEETTAIQPLSKIRDIRNIIQAERYKCSPSHPMSKRLDVLTKHQIKRESFIHKDNNLKKTYNNNNIKTVQCTYAIPPMSSDYTNRSLTIRKTTPTVTRDQEDTSKILLTLSHIDDRQRTIWTTFRWSTGAASGGTPDACYLDAERLIAWTHHMRYVPQKL